MRHLRYMLLGLRNIPGYGPHPGTMVLAALMALGAIAGGLYGSIIMLCVFGPTYLYGAYERGEGYLRSVEPGREDER